METHYIPIIPYNKDTVQFKQNYIIPGYIFKLAKLYMNNDINELDYLPIEEDLTKYYGYDFHLKNINYNNIIEVGDGVDLYLQTDFLITKNYAKIVMKDQVYYMIGFYKQKNLYKGIYIKDDTEQDVQSYLALITNIKFKPVNEYGIYVEKSFIIKSELLDIRYQPIVQFLDNNELFTDTNILFNIKQVNDESTNLISTVSTNFRVLNNTTTIDYNGIFNGQPPYMIGVNQELIDNYEDTKDFKQNDAQKVITIVNNYRNMHNVMNIPKTKMLHIRIEGSTQQSYINLDILTSMLFINKSIGNLVKTTVQHNLEWEEVLDYYKCLLQVFYYKDLQQLIDLLVINNTALNTRNTKEEIYLLRLIHNKPELKSKILFMLQMIKDDKQLIKENENNTIIN